MTPTWASSAIFYHIYPLGLCGAPQHNDFSTPPADRLDNLHAWIDHIQTLGANAVYLGPVFESSSHGYDTADYYQVDRRLGTNETLARLSAALHERGIHLVLDAVFNHVGRDFWAFQDVREHGAASVYTDWFHNLRFEGQSPYGDPFQYDAWNGHYSLVKLNLANPDVRAHLFDAVGTWISTFNIDGLRLDAADCLDIDFLRRLAAFTHTKRDDFWLMGEIIHGDYNRWANPDMLHSVTNYECFKGMYSSLNDANFHEIAYALNRQFGAGGLYKDLQLYNFADNHDVNRVASLLNDTAHLHPLYMLLFTMPGIPSIYYGSEWGLSGEKNGGDDSPMRPWIDLAAVQADSPHPELSGLLAKLAAIRKDSPALQHGSYVQLHVSGEQFAFQRSFNGNVVVTALNAAPRQVHLQLPVPPGASSAFDLLTGDVCAVEGDLLSITIPPRGGCILDLRFN